MPEPTRLDLRTLRDALAEHYLLERPLGRGGMGVVFLARDLHLERLVAVKVLWPHRAADPAARERFLREARTAGQLSHPHIVPIHAVYERGDVVLFSMAYVPGGTLGDRIRTSGPLPLPEGARVIREVAAALAYAHVRGVVHRDVKPDNILLEDGTGRALVTDFGIARLATASATTDPQRILGTAEFMSPEQATGGPVGPKSDLYSLGVVAFYTLSGRLPFAASDQYALLACHVAEAPPPLSAVAPHVPAALAAAIDRCLAKDPALRPADCLALARAVASAVGDGTRPLALRAFLTESRQLAAPARLYAAVLGLGVVPLVTWAAVSGRGAALLPGVLGLGVVAFALPLGIALGRARRLLAAGHGRAALVEALTAERARRREELAFVYGARPTRFELVLRSLTLGSLALGTAAAAVGTWWRGAGAGSALWDLVAAGCATAVVTAAIARARAELRDDPRALRRLRFWRGPLGRLVFRLAALWPPRGAHALEPSPSLD